jgi:hypothetical protein
VIKNVQHAVHNASSSATSLVVTAKSWCNSNKNVSTLSAYNAETTRISHTIRIAIRNAKRLCHVVTNVQEIALSALEASCINHVPKNVISSFHVVTWFHLHVGSNGLSAPRK